MILIGFTGKKYAGKDTAGRALVADHPKWHTTAFADPLREMLYTLNPICPWPVEGDGSVSGGSGVVGIPWQELWDTVGYDEMKKTPEVRRLMQVFGTEVMRQQFGQNVWVDLTMSKIWASKGSFWAITDVRFDNEARAIRERGGQVIEVVWAGPSTRDTHGDDHASEAGISRGLIDATVYNNGTADFAVQVRRVVDSLRR